MKPFFLSKRSRPGCLHGLLFFVSSVFALHGAAAESSLDEAAWQTIRERRFTDSAPAFAKALRAAPESRELAMGHAVSLLNKQPRTRENVARADALLARLEEEGGGDDNIAIMAGYLRARVAEVHLFEPDLKLAAARYEALIASAPLHPAAQMAVVKLATLRIYRLGNDPAKALADIETEAVRLADPAARRDYHLTMARSYLFFRVEDERALAHLEKAVEAGIVAPANSASTLASLGELARELGRNDLARAGYERFLKTHLRDQRVYMIRQRLAELGGEATAEAPPTPPSTQEPGLRAASR